jgi:Meckel syndrome type 1 protein
LITLVYVLAAPAALADRGPQPNADELWRSYPLEQEPATTAAAPAADGQSRASAPVADGGSDTGPPWAVLAAIGVASAALVGVVAARRRRRPAAASGYATGAAPPVRPDAVPPVGGNSAESAAVRPAAAAAAAPVAARVARGQAPYPARAQRPPAAAPPAAGAYDRPTAARKAPVCQIRWSRRGRRFYAATVDAEGTERRLGRSGVVDSAGPGPPEETPEARAALLRLAKELRERGWRPLRARGIDFDERQWYARRFRWPTDVEVAAGRPGGGAPSHEVTGRPGGPR